MITKHVTDLKRSKKLKEAGLPQEGGLFYWHTIKRENKKTDYMVDKYDKRVTPMFMDKGTMYKEPLYRAYLSTELNEWLPDWVYAVKEGERFYCWCSGDEAGESRNIPEKLEVEGTGILDEIEPIYGDTEQNAKADMIIYLVKEGIIKLKG